MNCDDSGVQIEVPSGHKLCSQNDARETSAIPQTYCLASTAVQASCTSMNVACQTDAIPLLKEPVLWTVKSATISIQPREINHRVWLYAKNVLANLQQKRLKSSSFIWHESPRWDNQWNQI